MALKRVVVTGLGALTPVGNTVPSMWEGMVDGVSGVGAITRFDAAEFKCRIAAELKEIFPKATWEVGKVTEEDIYGETEGVKVFIFIGSDYDEVPREE